MTQTDTPIVYDGGGIIIAFCARCGHNHRAQLGHYAADCFVLPPGFKPRGGNPPVYVMSHGAADRLRRGNPAAQYRITRVPPGPPVHMVEIDEHDNTIDAGHIAPLPCRVVCPTCGPHSKPWLITADLANGLL